MSVSFYVNGEGLVYKRTDGRTRSGNYYVVEECQGAEVYEQETDTEVIIYDFVNSEDGTQGEYLERERLVKVVDDPTTTDTDEGQSFWQSVWDRIAFWRGN